MDKKYALERYVQHVKELGYKGEDVTLLALGFVAGWDALDLALQKLTKAIREVE